MNGEVDFCIRFLFPFPLLECSWTDTWRSLAFRCFFELDVRYLLLLFVFALFRIGERAFVMSLHQHMKFYVISWSGYIMWWW